MPDITITVAIAWLCRCSFET